MSFAPYTNYQRPDNAPAIRGQFREKGHGGTFEFTENPAGGWLDNGEWPHMIFVGNHGERRFARILKTVAYVVIDEADDGTPIFEKWAISNRRGYN